MMTNIRYHGKIFNYVVLYALIFSLCASFLTFPAFADSPQNYKIEDDALYLYGDYGDGNAFLRVAPDKQTKKGEPYLINYFKIQGISGVAKAPEVILDDSNANTTIKVDVYIVLPYDSDLSSQFNIKAETNVSQVFMADTENPTAMNSTGLVRFVAGVAPGSAQSEEKTKGISVDLQAGAATQSVYAKAASFGGATINFHFSIDENAGGNVDADSVKSIYVKEYPTKTTYNVGDHFNPAGMKVFAVKGDGTKTEIEGGYEYPKEPLKLSDTVVTISYNDHTADVPITVDPRAAITNTEILNGQRLTNFYKEGLDNTVVTKENDYNAVIWYGEKTGNFEISVDKGSTLLVNGRQATVKSTENDTTVYSVELDTKGSYGTPEGASSTITVNNGKGEEESYRFRCFSQCFPGMPNRVTEYISIFSQYTNGAHLHTSYGLSAEGTLRGANFTEMSIGSYETGGSTLAGPYSVGNFGSYIIYQFHEPVRNDPSNPYGVDLIVSGNSYNAANGFAEPGQVWVSKNGTDWYALAGSAHYDNACIWDKTITYYSDGTLSEDGGVTRTKAPASIANFPSRKYYPLFDWSTAKNEPDGTRSLTVTGIQLSPGDTNEYGNLLPVDAHFGYVDTAIQGIGLNRPDSDTSVDPYTQAESSTGGKDHYDSFDLDWAVDSSGKPVYLDEVSYVKVQTAAMIWNGAIGEKSTEVSGLRAINTGGAASVGRTDAPASITIDGKALKLEDGKYEYDAEVSGGFTVLVDSSEENVYINDVYSKVCTFFEMPEHQMLRIILQSGEKEPAIYYISLTNSAGQQKTKEVILDANGGLLDPHHDEKGELTGYATLTLTYDNGMVGAEFPVPHPGLGNYTREFAGWRYEGQRYYSAYESWMDGITLTAVWKEKQQDSGGGGGSSANHDIQVSFRLIGSSLAELKDENDGIDLGNGDYKGAEYQTWIPTRTYTMQRGDTVLDLLETALERAGIDYENPSGNYITAIYAPSSMGGHRLAEMTNGPRSGWMYTLNGDHALDSVAEQILHNNDKVVLHYVNDYAYEVADWDKLGEASFPALGDSAYHNAWLKAPDGATGGGASRAEARKTPARTEVSGGKAKVTVQDGDIPTGATGYVVITPDESAADVASVTVTLTAGQVDKVADRSAGLRLECGLGSVSLAARGMKDLGLAQSDAFELSMEKDEKGRISVQAAVNGKAAENVTGGLKVGVPAAEGEVLVLVGPDGAETVVRKSLVENGQIKALLDGSCTVRVIHSSADFSDVADSAWYAGAVDFASGHALFNGTGGNAFSPDAPMTRGMMATVLWRLEGEQDAEATGAFTDVADGTWYTEGVAWASGHGIVEGYGGRFEPDGDITREQLATMLWRYAKDLGMDGTASDDLDGFADGDAVSGYASDAVKWAVGAGLIQGKDGGRLDPAGDATRAEVAAVLERVVRMIVA